MGLIRRRTRAEVDAANYRRHAADLADRMLRALLEIEDVAAERAAGHRWRAAMARRRAREYDREIVDWFEAGRLPAVLSPEWDAYGENIAHAIDEFERGAP